jgi:hypothetical protein
VRQKGEFPLPSRIEWQDASRPPEHNFPPLTIRHPNHHRAVEFAVSRPGINANGDVGTRHQPLRNGHWLRRLLLLSEQPSTSDGYGEQDDGEHESTHESTSER